MNSLGFMGSFLAKNEGLLWIMVLLVETFNTIQETGPLTVLKNVVLELIVC